MLYYILLTKRVGRTGRISARGLDIQKRQRADILPVRSRASLLNKGFITQLETAFKENLYTENWYPEDFMKTMCGKNLKKKKKLLSQLSTQEFCSDFQKYCSYFPPY